MKFINIINVVGDKPMGDDNYVDIVIDTYMISKYKACCYIILIYGICIVI